MRLHVLVRARARDVEEGAARPGGEGARGPLVLTGVPTTRSRQDGILMKWEPPLLKRRVSRATAPVSQAEGWACAPGRNAPGAR